MDRVPCRVSLDLRRHMAEQDRAELEDAASLDERRFEAEQNVTDPEALKKVLNDADLALPLSDCFRHLEQAKAGNQVAQFAIFGAIERMEKSCIDWLMGE